MKNLASESEMEVLKIVWGQENPSSASIIEALSQSQTWGKTTIKTMLARLVQKGLLEVKQDGRKYTYYATLSEEEAMYQRVDALAQSICATNMGNILTYLIDKYDLSIDDKNTILNTIDHKKFKNKVECNCVMKHHLNCGCKSEGCSCMK